MATVPYFSLVDEDFTRKLTEDAAADDDIDYEEDRKLMYKWVLWEQLQPNQKASAAEWKDLSRQVCTFGTVGEFWRYWRHVPQPSELLSEAGGCRFVREGDDGSLRVVESMMVFRDGIKPEWEDPLNAIGGHLQFSLGPNVGGKQIDEYWNNIVLGVIGNTLPYPDMITGLRLCDKLYTKRGPPQGSVRIEVWFTNMADTEKVDELTKGIQECICTKLDGTISTNSPKYDLKSHGGKH
ncbi:eukaryotic translation initiation factor 4E type, putative [Perkinsus marinus ATCC 50983]|uniref:Eukaryotic translation initiation factor 4E type, putative n=1 Tax=Perkinsus marinus (strain ATCC 50983 / TXsc) TaxID=423536 RepID=C5LIT7_PERM5|nr:eukaryotic translation initiation factor 4E type, putative [Perkinsus marinus ATCC 50983]EER03490.1 eukaryotic translation initiation factor 4E type, putative [Perkinsus marinus ATCC 50983]|eukprot:XP_002771674.1 eukaryotic translation initiation factor 4E type, putative [Perkinsus marinus ATCC 50983]